MTARPDRRRPRGRPGSWMHRITRWVAAAQIQMIRSTDAALAREGGPLRTNGRAWRVIPFAIITAIGLTLEALPGGSFQGWDTHVETTIAALVLMTVVIVAALAIPWDRIDPAWQAIIPFGAIVAVLLARHAEHSTNASLTVLYLLPVMWLALYSPTWQLWTGIVLTVLAVLLPPVLDEPLLGENHYPFDDYRRTLLVLIIILFVTGALRIAANAAAIDTLTGLPNRRVFTAMLLRRARTVTRTAAPVTVGVLDLDHFKLFNDAHGHDGGDRLLRAAADHWRAQLREGDVIGRIGGEEFGLIIRGGPDDAAVVAERLIRGLPDGQTASIGLAALGRGEDADHALIRADGALYAAKESGRACVRMAPAYTAA